MTFNPPLDKKIERAVNILYDAGIETFESCQGGTGHAYPEPTIRFHGDKMEGFNALTVAIRNNLNVAALRRVYDVLDGELTGPYWEMILTPQ
jgi:hypothetical protein